MPAEPKFFATPKAFRAWLAKNHATATELLVGYYKKETGRASITWPESVDEALCYGWIDGIRRRIDDESYSIRFTPRRADSNWSAVNVRRVEALIAEGRMQPPGLKIYEARREDRTARYSFEQRRAEFDPERLRTFQSNQPAWTFFSTQPPGYRRIATWWVMSAKQDATRDRRLAKLIDYSSRNECPPEFLRTKPTVADVLESEAKSER